MKDQILNLLSSDYPWKDLLQYYPAIGSTNDALKLLARQGAPQGTAILAGRQTNGHGRLGRSFHSPEGMGIYLSLLLRPDYAPAEIMHLTCAAAVAMCNAVEAAAGFRPQIKWTNDLVWNRKKLGGILTELGFTSQGALDWAIIGVGLNCCQQPGDFPEEIRDIAASVSAAAGKKVEPAVLAASMLDALYRMDLTEKQAVLCRYRRDCITIGREISVVRGDSVHHGTALDVDSDGALVVQYADGSREAVNSGEVSIRGMYGYV